MGAGGGTGREEGLGSPGMVCWGGVSSAAQMGCWCNRRGAHQGQTSRAKERDDKGPPAHTPHRHSPRGAPPPYPIRGPPSPTQCTPALPLRTTETLAVEETS